MENLIIIIKFQVAEKPKGKYYLGILLQTQNCTEIMFEEVLPIQRERQLTISHKAMVKWFSLRA